MPESGAGTDSASARISPRVYRLLSTMISVTASRAGVARSSANPRRLISPQPAPLCFPTPASSSGLRLKATICRFKVRDNHCQLRPTLPHPAVSAAHHLPFLPPPPYLSGHPPGRGPISHCPPPAATLSPPSVSVTQSPNMSGLPPTSLFQQSLSLLGVASRHPPSPIITCSRCRPTSNTLSGTESICSVFTLLRATKRTS